MYNGGRIYIVLNRKFVEQPEISYQQFLAVNFSFKPVARNFLYFVQDNFVINSAYKLIDGSGYRMCTLTFQCIYQLEDFIPIYIGLQIYLLYFEYPFGHGAGFIHHHMLNCGNGV